MSKFVFITIKQVKKNIMYTQQISLSLKGQITSDYYGQLHHFLGTLRRSGQIISKVYPIIQRMDCFEVVVMTLELTSLEKQNDSIYSLKLRKSFGKALRIKLLGNNDLESNLCTCKMPDAYILQTHYLKIGSPVHCGDCFGEVPLYRLGKKEGYDAIIGWERNYIACDTLQMNCVVGETFGINQMSDLESELSQLGLKCCEEIERLTQKPSYYYLYNYRATSQEEDKNRTCPNCDESWFLKDRILDRFDFKCTTCHLLSNLSYQS